jgi:heterodisulfide reductase subunit B
MKYLYYPGCSLEGTATEYHASTRAFLEAVGVELQEIEDWTCCGASAAEAVSEWLSYALPARNIALAEKMNNGRDILVPCSACYLNLKKVEQNAKEKAVFRETVNQILAEEGLSIQGKTTVRHLLDVLSRDLGAKKIKKRVTRPLAGLTIAPYYGCQCLRPYRVFDDPEQPQSMAPLIEAAGATVHPWDMGGRCCGASHMNTKQKVALQLVGGILKAARGADAVATVCPMCQMNLEAYQSRVSEEFGEDLNITVVYLPQLLGLAVGMSEKEVRLDLNLAVLPGFREKLP